MSTTRYRCTACGNLTRFDVTSTRTTRQFQHFTVGGDLVVDDEVVLNERTDEVACRWCGHGRGVEVLSAAPETSDDAVPSESGRAPRERRAAASVARERRRHTHLSRAARPTPADFGGTTPVGTGDGNRAHPGRWTLLLFLGEECDGCRDFWDAATDPVARGWRVTNTS